MKKAAVLLLILTACASTQQSTVEPVTVQTSTAPTFSGASVRYHADHSDAVRIVVQEFRARNLRIYMPKQGDVRSFGAGVDYRTQPIVEGAAQQDGKPIWIPAVPNAEGVYEQPVTGTEQGAMVRQTLYSATIDSTTIHVVKTVAVSNKPERVEVPVEVELLQSIAAELPGGVVELHP